MNQFRLASIALSIAISFPASSAFAQRGGRAGGAMRGGGGGGMARPGGGMGGGRSPSFSAPAARPSGGMARPGGGGAANLGRPAGGANISRPAGMQNRPAQLPGGGGAQARPMPSPGGGNRPATLPGNIGGGGANRPNLPGGGAGNRPTTLPGNIGGGAGNRPNLPGGGAGNRPTTLPGNIGGGVGNRPNLPGGGAGNRPTTLPGNIGGGAGNRPNLPGGGNGNRPTTLPGNIGGGNRPNLPGGGDRPTTLPGIPGAGNRPNLPGGGNGNFPNMPGGGNGNRPNLPGGGNGNRPNLPGGGNGNRPNFPNLPGGGNGNRPNLPGGGNGNRPNLPGGGNNVFPGGIGNNVNRPNYGGNTINRPNVGNGNTVINNRPNVNNITQNNNSFNFNNFGGNTNVNGGWGGGWNGGGWNGGGWNGGGYYGRPGYWGGFSNAYHNGWVNGYWHGHNNANWNSWGSGFGWGLAAWGLGTSLFNWGYTPYVNPYYIAVPQTQTIVVQQPVPYAAATITPTSFDYSRPYDLDAAPPTQEVADSAVDVFDQAREAFKIGNYAQSLTLTDQAITKLPNDTAMQEFRALVLFALKDYDRAAAVLYSVLSVGPGWDWTTLIGLYADSEAYTAQLRTLESFRSANPTSASAAFVLAYHYMTAGYGEAAAKQLESVVKLKPSDRLSAELLKRLTTPAPGSAQDDAAAAPAANTQEAQPPAAPQPPAETAPTVPPGELPGVWAATPTDGVTITLTLKKEGGFTWAVKDKSGERSFAGDSSVGNNILTLAPPNGSPMVGKLTWKSATEFNFKVLGSSNDDPGLNFKKAG